MRDVVIVADPCSIDPRSEMSRDLQLDAH